MQIPKAAKTYSGAMLQSMALREPFQESAYYFESIDVRVIRQVFQNVALCTEWGNDGW